MPYEYKKSKGQVWGVGTRPKLPADLCCDGCDEKCRFSLSLQVEDQKYKPRKGSQQFVIKPAISAGDKNLYKLGMFACVRHFANEIGVDFDLRNAEAIYQNALHWCRKTCKHSKMR